ncbi:tail fiber domain-containing protein, partial [Patescibacteria group bacterium]|nr:tail fiber domain-containing protein [Patescibacteria group bacterium]
NVFQAFATASTSTWETLSANYAGAEHTFKVVMTATTAAFYIDGTQVGPTMTYSFSGSTTLVGRTYDANQYIKIKTINITSTISGAAQALTVGNSGDGSYAVANAWNTFSDRRFKKNINPIPPTTALQDVLSLQGVTFNWIKDNQPSIGFIAQDVQKIVPQIVSADQQGYLSVDYSKITPILVQAVKKQQQEISQQNTTIAIQQQEIDQLKMKLGMQ